MRTTITIPNGLIRKAKRVAHKLGISRNQLFANAISEFLDRRRTSEITKRLKKAYAKKPSGLEAALHSAQIRSLGKDRW